MKAHPIAPVLAALALAALPAAARAGDAACLWSHLPADKTSEDIETYVRSAGETPYEFDESLLVIAFGACGVTTQDQVKPAAAAFAAYEMRRGASEYLRRNHGVSENAIMAAWLGVSTADRSRFTADMLADAMPDGESDFIRPLIAGLTDRLGITGNKLATHQLLAYITAMINEEAAEKLY
ncbi:MAG: hypothetical protein JWP35_750 [Caulobacter sp.]|nr:hypothetical protein [Caulobacter sp.]